MILYKEFDSTLIERVKEIYALEEGHMISYFR